MMKTLGVILSLVLVALAGAPPPAAAQQSDDVHREEGLALPRDHQYERYEHSTRTYTPVEVGRVGNLVRRNEAVYDRTAKAWVYTPGKGVNPAYSATASGQARPGSSRGQGNWERRSGDWDGDGGLARVNGRVTSVNDDRIIVREDQGREVTVNMSEARTRLRQGLKVGDRVSVVGVPTGPNRLNARAVREQGAGGKGAQDRAGDDGWQRIHGRVQAVQGDSMRFRTDDGRTLTVDLSPVGDEIRRALRAGESVTVIGYDWTGPNQLRAEYVQQDSSDPSRGGSVAPSASPRERR
jgi:hypothetical protein